MSDNFPLPSPPDHPSVIQRNFVPFSVADQPGIRYLRHISGVIVLSLGADHELMRNNKDISEIAWNPSSSTTESDGKQRKKRGRGLDRSKMELSGKGKKGGLQMLPETRICIVRDTDGKEHVIRAGIRATLLEVNDERLDADPNLLRSAPDNHGFIAILMPPIGNGREVNMPKELIRHGTASSTTTAQEDREGLTT